MSKVLNISRDEYLTHRREQSRILMKQRYDLLKGDPEFMEKRNLASKKYNGNNKERISANKKMYYAMKTEFKRLCNIDVNEMLCN